MLTIAPPSAIRSSEPLGEEEDALEVDVDEPVELRFGHLGEAAVGGVAGVVDEVVEGVASPGAPAGSAARVSAKASKLELSPTSSCSASGLAAEGLELGDDRLGLLGVGAVGDDRVDAVGGEGERGAAADAAVAAGDQGDALG